MTQRDFANALLRGEHPIDVEVLTACVLRRDRRRIWLLGTLCVIAWMLVVMLPWSTLLPMMAKIGQHLAAEPASLNTPEARLELAKIVKVGTVATFVGSIASMLMASVCTVALIVLSRRATLRQVNARLAEISEQLRAMAERSANKPG